MEARFRLTALRLPNGGTLSVQCRPPRKRGGIGECSCLETGNRHQDSPFGKLKQPSPNQSEIRQVDRVRLKVPAVERSLPYQSFSFAVMDGKRVAKAKRMNESSKRHLMMGLQGKKAKRQAETAPVPSAGVDPVDQTLADRLQQLNAETRSASAIVAGSKPKRGQTTEATSSKGIGKRLVTVDLEAEPAPKRSRQGVVPMAILAAEDDDNPAKPITIGSQMELSEIEELPKKLLREEAGRAFRLQALRAITAAERAKKAYEDGRARVAETGKALQDHAHLLKDKQAAEQQVQASEAKLAEMTVVWSLRSQQQRMPKFSILLDKEVGSEMVDLLYRFKRYNPGQKLNLNFIANPPPLPEGMTEEIIEDYEGEDAPGEAFVAEGSATNEGADDDGEEAAA
ncbi:unnamed protein product [Prunus armeniaca]